MTSVEQDGAAVGSPPVLGVIVVNYASSDLLTRNLAGAALEHCRVVVVDNLSDEPERQRVRLLCAAQRWTLVEQPDNRGFGPGVNAGAEAARRLGCTSVLLLNPDVVVRHEVVDELRRQSAAEPDVLVSPRLVDGSGRVVFDGHDLDLLDGRITSARKKPAHPRRGSDPVFWLTAACLAVHLDLWHRLGGFDESYFMYWEDVDFAYRGLRTGARMVLRADLTAVHEQGGTQGSRRGRAKSGLYYRYNTRNRMLFAARQLDRRRVLRWLVASPRVGYEIWLHGGRRQLWQAPSGTWAAFHGTCAGLAIGVRRLLVPAAR